MMRRTVGCLAIGLAMMLGSSAPARADFTTVVTFGLPQTIVAGSVATTTMDVTLSLPAGGGINQLSLVFDVSGPNGAYSSAVAMEFLDQGNQTDPNSTLSHANYVLAPSPPGSAAILTSSNFGTASVPPSQPGPPFFKTVFSANDFTTDFSDEPITPANNLLAALVLKVPTNALLPTGDVYTISLDTSTSGAFFTQFTNASGDVSQGSDIAATTSTITILPPNVPEPSSMVILLSGLVTTSFVSWRSYRKRGLALPSNPADQG